MCLLSIGYVYIRVAEIFHPTPSTVAGAGTGLWTGLNCERKVITRQTSESDAETIKGARGHTSYSFPITGAASIPDKEKIGTFNPTR